MNESARIAFVGGGNMAAALIGGLVGSGVGADRLRVVEVDAARRRQLEELFGVATLAAPDDPLRDVDVLVLAVKPQQMKDVCTALAPYIGRQLVLSIAAGIRARDLVRWLGTQTIVRSMPNTPALIGAGVSGLVALPATSARQREQAERILRAAGAVVWCEHEDDLDAVTAVSGSGPAYVFYFVEALIAAAVAEGLSEVQARTLAVATFKGAAELAARSDEPLALLRQRVTSKGGTTAAALSRLEDDRVSAAIAAAVHAARVRAAELGDEFGR